MHVLLVVMMKYSWIISSQWKSRPRRICWRSIDEHPEPVTLWHTVTMETCCSYSVSGNFNKDTFCNNNIIIRKKHFVVRLKLNLASFNIVLVILCKWKVVRLDDPVHSGSEKLCMPLYANNIHYWLFPFLDYLVVSIRWK